MKININWKEIEAQVAQLAAGVLKGYTKQALSDLKDYRIKVQDKLNNWLLALRDDEIDQDDFNDLVKGERDLAELHALKQLGLAQVSLDLFTEGLLNIVIAVAKSAIKL